MSQNLTQSFVPTIFYPTQNISSLVLPIPRYSVVEVGTLSFISPFWVIALLMIAVLMYRKNRLHTCKVIITRCKIACGYIALAIHTSLISLIDLTNGYIMDDGSNSVMDEEKEMATMLQGVTLVLISPRMGIRPFFTYTLVCVYLWMNMLVNDDA